MKTLNRLLLATGVATLLGLSAGNAFAQERPGRGNFNPEAFRQRAMERYREQLEVKNDDEWKVVSTRIDKVLEARREIGFGGGFGRGGRGGGGGGGGGNGGAGAGGGASAGGGGGDQGGDRERRARFGGEPSPEAEALQKALESKASPDEIKAKLAKYREARKTKEAKLTAAQDELRKVLSVRQEAAAVMGGLLQ